MTRTPSDARPRSRESPVPSCQNRNRTTRICRRSCCRKIPLVSNQVITRRRKYFDHSKYNTCTVCKGRIYVSSGQQCLLTSEGNVFDCIPSF
ncbi:MAG: F-box/kelch-repeat protein [Cressdnaviricota sp.]|nr:MAG: F-box/kelch-repeat protein [Cressdnaviricota sp.]